MEIYHRRMDISVALSTLGRYEVLLALQSLNANRSRAFDAQLAMKSESIEKGIQ